MGDLGMDGQRARLQRGPMTSKILLNHPISDENPTFSPLGSLALPIDTCLPPGLIGRPIYQLDVR